MKKSKKLDQFYTNPLVAEQLVQSLKKLFPWIKNKKFIEPSAGTGNFIDALLKNGIRKSKIKAFDIDPKGENIIKMNYLTLKRKFSRNTVIIGNPPFGKRGSLALEFLNKSLNESPFVAMILPNIFNRYSIQKKVNINTKLVYSEQLGENSFILKDKKYGVKCVFQVWRNNATSASNLRILQPLQIRHDDFKTWIHNNTKATLKYFKKKKYKWNFAVCRQGYYNYKKKITKSEDLIKNRQYFFIKAESEEILKRIRKINFEKLSKTNTQVLGFSTTDFVKEYINIKEMENAL